MPEFERDGVPFIPNTLHTNLSSSQMYELMSNAKSWFKRDNIKAAIEIACTKTYESLKHNDEITDDGGTCIEFGEWFPISQLDKIVLDESVNSDDKEKIKRKYVMEARLDLRIGMLRTQIFAEGMVRVLRKLENMEALPKHAVKYIDPATNLVPWDIYQALMGFNLAGKAESFINLDRMKKSYEYAKGSDENVVYGRLVYLTHLGLLTVDIPSERVWEIRIGNVAVDFHEIVFLPTLKHFAPMLSQSWHI